MKYCFRYIPNARLVEQMGLEIVYVLPSDEENSMKQFESLFAELDNNLKKLRISTYGISDTTLEEVNVSK